MSESVNLKTYCHVFENYSPVLSKQICEGLAGKNYGSRIRLFKDSESSGSVNTQRYSGPVVNGRRAFEWRWFSIYGEITRLRADGEVVLRVPGRGAKYFIGGAFGESEIGRGSGLSSAIVSGLNRLYSLCLRRPDGCNDSRVAQNLRAAVQAERTQLAQTEELNALRRRLADLKGDYSRIEEQSTNKALLQSRVAVYDIAIPQNPTSLSDFKKAVRLMELKLKLARLHMDEENRTRVANANRKQRRNYILGLRREISRYQALQPKYREWIRKAQSFGYSRFTWAYDEALKCMPTGTTVQERYCVAKNKSDMAGYLLKATEEHKRDGSECLRWERGSGGGRSSSHCPDCGGDTRETSVCVQYYKTTINVSAQHILGVAKSYCRATCDLPQQ